MTAGQSRFRLRRAQRGIALVLVLWITVLLTVIAASFAFDMRNEALAARNAVSLAQAKAIADGAVERFVWETSRPVVQPAQGGDLGVLPQPWRPDGVLHEWTEAGAKVVASAVDESARIDLNAIPDAMLRALLVQVGQADDAKANELVDAIADWRDLDDLRRPNGAEEADYVAANSRYRPANAPFESVSDLAKVLGMTPEIYARIAPALTVYTRVAGVNVRTASRIVLLAIPNVTAEQVDTYLAARDAALASNLPPPPFAWGQGFVGSPSPVSRIHAEVTMPDGVTFVREAVVRPSPDPQRPLTVLLWTEAPVGLARASPAAPDASQSVTPPDAARP